MNTEFVMFLLLSEEPPRVKIRKLKSSGNGHRRCQFLSQLHEFFQYSFAMNITNESD